MQPINIIFKFLIFFVILSFYFSADNFRPYLTSFQGNAFTDYINAVFVDVSCVFRKYDFFVFI